VTVHAINIYPDGTPSGPIQVSVRGEMQYPGSGGGTGSCVVYRYLKGLFLKGVFHR
jgi:hypothetical protein